MNHFDSDLEEKRIEWAINVFLRGDAGVLRYEGIRRPRGTVNNTINRIFRRSKDVPGSERDLPEDAMMTIYSSNIYRDLDGLVREHPLLVDIAGTLNRKKAGMKELHSMMAKLGGIREEIKLEPRLESNHEEAVKSFNRKKLLLNRIDGVLEERYKRQHNKAMWFGGAALASWTFALALGFGYSLKSAYNENLEYKEAVVVEESTQRQEGVAAIGLEGLVSRYKPAEEPKELQDGSKTTKTEEKVQSEATFEKTDEQKQHEADKSLTSTKETIKAHEEISSMEEAAGEKPIEELKKETEGIEIRAKAGWGLSDYAIVNLGYDTYEGWSNKAFAQKRNFFNSLMKGGERRKSLDEEVARIHDINKDKTGFRADDRNYVRMGSLMLIEQRRGDVDLGQQYASLIVGGRVVEVAKAVEEKKPEVKADEDAIGFAARDKIKKPSKHELKKDTNCLREAYNTNNPECLYMLMSKSIRKPLCAYFDTMNPKNMGMYGRANLELDKGFRSYAEDNNIEELVRSIDKALDEFNIVKDKNGKLRIKPSVGVDGKKVPGVWISKQGLDNAIDIVEALESNVEEYFSRTYKKDDAGWTWDHSKAMDMFMKYKQRTVSLKLSN